jgi:hypothetical protein
MATREISPIVRTYLKQSTSPTGKAQIHARIYSREYGLDKRGTGRTISSAIKRAKTGVARPK